MTKTNPLWYIIAVVAILAVGYIFLGTDEQPNIQCPPGYAVYGNTCVQVQSGGGQAQPAGATPAQPAAVGKVPIGVQKGTFSIPPTDQGSNTPAGTSSNMLLLDASYWKGDGHTTSLYLQKLISDPGESTLKYYNGASETKVHSTGTWSWTIYPKAYRSGIDILTDDKAVLYSYFDKTPGIRENKSQAKLVSFGRYDAPSSTWSASFEDGATTLKLTSYAQFNITDTNGRQKSGYELADGGSVLSSQTITFQMNASEIGQELVDGALFVTAPRNYTNYFKSISLTAKAVKPGSSDPQTVKYTAGDLLYTGFPDNIAKVINILPAAPTSNDYVWFVGYLPQGWDTERTSSDSREVKGSIETDTYGTAVNSTWYVVQNAHALSGRNSDGAINTFTNGFITNYSTRSTTVTGFFN